MASSQAREILQQIFGYPAFRGLQEPSIESVLAGRSAVALMPTGSGKSLCYQVPARVFSERRPGSLTLVISPLIALMKDQVDAAAKRGLKCAFINSSLSGDERAARYRALAAGRYELLYVTPERFRIPEFRDALAKNHVALLAVDEAHCISQWGQDFRPDYSRLGEIREQLGRPTTIALTATATPAVEADIVAQLSLESDRTDVYRQSVRRPNLAISVYDVHGIEDKVRAFVMAQHESQRTNPGSAIVYFSLIQTLSAFSDQLARLSMPHVIYHGQLGDRDRRRAQEAFLREDGALALATPAFGLGVDKANVRLVAHAEIPGSIEAYVQEIGRAGRDGAAATCALFHDADDQAIQTDFIKWANPDPGFVQGVYNLIERNPLRARSEGFEYLRGQMNFYNRRDFRVETAVNLLERWGAIEGRNPREWRAVAPPSDEYMDAKLFEARARALGRKLWEMAEFADASEGCRMARVQAYFGEADASPCGVCDLCVARAARA